MKTSERRKSTGSTNKKQKDMGGNRMTEEETEQGALFQIEGPDEDGCVWACSPEGRDIGVRT
jgi:hypothetical protein